MSWVPAERVLETVAAQRQQLAAEDARIHTAEEFHAAERAKVQAEGIQAAEDLARAVLPRFDAPSIAQAAALVGLAGLPGEDLPGKLEARRAWLRARLQHIAHDPRYVNGELLHHPRTGTLVTALVEARDLRSGPFATVETCASHPRFERLIAIGYGTDADKGNWWRYSHWVDRSAANEIIARLPGRMTFADVRAHYEQARDAVAVYDAEIGRLSAEIAAGEALEKEYAERYDEHQHVDARALDYARGRLVKHMLSADASLVSQRLASTPDVRLLFLRASGLAAKLAYLDGVQQNHLGEIRGQIALESARLATIDERTRRKWAPMPSDKFAKLAVDRSPAYAKRWQRFGKVYTSVSSFRSWDRARRYDDLLWWDLMTRGRYDGSYLPEVSYFHDRHPAYVFDADRLRGGWSSDDGTVSGDDAGRDEAEAAALAADDAIDAADGGTVSAGLARADAS